ncbi:RNA 2'-phosphotransferase [Chromobacterium violaceum]|uniref:Probable RNA 2'-phosphotransferase n=1 Tax=Chromobacterium violaceum TaxID=536 RepID=A0A381EUZ6_CHRVL|nr:RNA 2'-phosphotransferase [Chromobacterium violaceum]KJH66488.1 RNA 2'-phosphotransferase [Chromobacterium violaceum]MBT2867662.1 RNA 2'-phosphotransferase [Chromobacterium violaceum]STB63781.1 RNA 2'-phosphotransferase [Chromobacterium violaceum]SUX32432.1 RNA 2'-phosphotransferase [Chromobacterium violaceum]VEB43065.1 RNA 2'-phosphotransferase [Chromobacterium violaceum]
MRNTQDDHSRFLSLVLRHQPETIGLQLDDQGWADIGELLARLAAKGRNLGRKQLEKIVLDNDKQRFAISEDGLRIRANQGHSIKIDLGLAACEPPDRLYHGTASRFLDAILAEGLRPGQRQHVHLSADWQTARKVGARHGKPVVLEIDARAMRQAGLAFYRSDNGVWLIDGVPPVFIRQTEAR